VSEAPEVPEDDVQYDTDSEPDDAVESDNGDDTLDLLKSRNNSQWESCPSPIFLLRGLLK